MNPIYIEHYIHEGCDCYKLDMPWTKYAKDTQVLCRVDQGYEFAMKLAMGLLSIYFCNLIADKPV